MSDALKVTLAGNPNSGKTTLFNELTRSNQHVGNWAGVTVERKSGRYHADRSIEIVDLPGVYSLTPYSEDERVADDYIESGAGDVVIDVVDCTCLKRSLFLTTQLLTRCDRVVVALNIADEAEKLGVEIDVADLSKLLGAKVVKISALKKTGIDELMRAVRESASDAAAGNKLKIGESAESVYRFIDRTVASAVISRKPKRTLSDRIDAVLTNKYAAFPIFALIMWLVFFISIQLVGNVTVDAMDALVDMCASAVRSAMKGVDEKYVSLVADGVIGGVGSVVCYVPEIMVLFGLISILEACGYMARVAFIFDRLLRWLGLSGKSFIPLILGCGCSVPAILGTRVIRDRREREATVALVPFVPCSAKLAMYSYFTGALFGGNALYATSMYFLGISAAIMLALILKAVSKKDGENTFIMELPPYRAPKWRNVFTDMAERGKAFLLKAGSVIFIASVALWVLRSFDASFRYVATPQGSMLEDIGRLVAPLFRPLGFGSWELAVSVLSGVVAKEAVISTMEILGVTANVGAYMTLGGAYSFMLFNTLCSTCVAGIAATAKELGKPSKTLKTIALQISVAYALTLAVYSLTELSRSIRAAVIIGILLSVAAVFAVKRMIRGVKCGGNCALCTNKRRCGKRLG